MARDREAVRLEMERFASESDRALYKEIAGSENNMLKTYILLLMITPCDEIQHNAMAGSIHYPIHDYVFLRLLAAFLLYLALMTPGSTTRATMCA